MCCILPLLFPLLCNLVRVFIWCSGRSTQLKWVLKNNWGIFRDCRYFGSYHGLDALVLLVRLLQWLGFPAAVLFRSADGELPQSGRGPGFWAGSHRPVWNTMSVIKRNPQSGILADGIHWNKLFTRTSPDQKLTLGHCFIMLVVDGIYLMVFTWYVEAVYPGGEGVPQKLYFFIQVG